MSQRQALAETEQVLWEHLTQDSAPAARILLNKLPHQDALRLLVRVLRHDHAELQRRNHRQWPLLAVMLIVGLLIHFGIPREYAPIRDFLTGLLVFSGLAFASLARVQSLCPQTACTLLPALLPQTVRTDLGLILELTYYLQTNKRFWAGAEGSELMRWLVYWLPRTPTDELILLSAEARRALQTLTATMLRPPFRKDSRAELAVAGLLALGTLRDPALRAKAAPLVNNHPNSSVQAAVAEYLSQL